MISGSSSLRMRSDCELVLGIDVGVQQADRNCLDVGGSDLGGDSPDVSCVQRRQHSAAGVEPLVDAEAQVPRDERPWLHEAEVVQRRTRPSRNLEDVAESLGRDERRPRRLAFDDRVRGDRCRVNDVFDRVPRSAGLDQHALGGAGEPVERSSGVLRDLGDLDLAGPLVDQRRIRERPADVDAEPDRIGGRCRPAAHDLPRVRGRPARRSPLRAPVLRSSTVQERTSIATRYTSRARATLTFPSRTSASTSSGSRSVGEP